MLLTAGAVLAVALGAVPTTQADGHDYLRACYRKGEAGKLEESIDLCTRAINSGNLADPSLSAAYINRSISYRELRQYDKAIADCEKALSLGQDDFEAHMACANAYGGKAEFNTSLQHYDAAQKLEPDDAVVYNNRANHLNQMGEYEQALKDIEVALRLDDDYMLALMNRGGVLYNLGRFPEAAKAMEAAVDEDEENAYALLWLVMARQRAGIEMKPADVMAAAEDIDRKTWPWPIVAYYGGETVDFAQALRFGDSAVEAGGTADVVRDCEASFYYGEMANLRGEIAEAKTRLQHAADTCPKTFIEHAGALAELKRF
jgi:tetratricopeptide (TPR) repeat protein